MRNRSVILLILGVFLAACAAPQPATPTETFKTYALAIRQKDYTAMKLLLSDETLRMHQQEAKAQNTNIDEILKREAVVGEGQRTVEYRNEKIDGDKATLEYKSAYGSWETMTFVREDGAWKIDKRAQMDQMLQDMDQSNRRLDDIIRGVSPL
jgi:hypothetical protein